MWVMTVTQSRTKGKDLRWRDQHPHACVHVPIHPYSCHRQSGTLTATEGQSAEEASAGRKCFGPWRYHGAGLCPTLPGACPTSGSAIRGNRHLCPPTQSELELSVPLQPKHSRWYLVIILDTGPALGKRYSNSVKIVSNCSLYISAYVTV